MTTEPFFNEQTEQSLVKATIVERYFRAWASVMRAVFDRTGREPKIAYIDLFAGPGRYRDGAKSTPLKVVEGAVEDPWLRESLVTVFNDKDEDAVRDLQSALDALPGVERLKHRPHVQHDEVGEELVKMFAGMRLVPTLFFVDPFGYKGLSLRLINSVLKDWGCDAIIFFNFNRINMGIGNFAVEPHMKALFGDENLEDLRTELREMTPRQREEHIINAIGAALMNLAGREVFVLPFRFLRADGARTSHYLMFVTKDLKGLKLMKEVMARSSESDGDGVPFFEYSPGPGRQPMLFEANRIALLADKLAEHFAGRHVRFTELMSEFEKSQLGTPFLEKHYRDALAVLERAGRIEFSYDGARKRPRFTYAARTLIRFPT